MLMLRSNDNLKSILPKHIVSMVVLVCEIREAITGCIRLVKPRSVFSRPASRATPFWTSTFPECKWVTVGNPLSFKKINASNTCRPICWTWGKGSPLPLEAYFWPQSSFQPVLSIYRTGTATRHKSPRFSSDRCCRAITPYTTHPVYQVFQTTLTDRLDQDHVILVLVFEKIDIEYRTYVRMLQR